MNQQSNNEPDIIKIADILWAFHNARLADPSLREMKPYVEPILQLINEARIDENQRYLDLLDTYIDKSRQPQAVSFGSASGAIQNAGWKRALTDRLAHLKSTNQFKE